MHSIQELNSFPSQRRRPVKGLKQGKVVSHSPPQELNSFPDQKRRPAKGLRQGKVVGHSLPTMHNFAVRLSHSLPKKVYIFSFSTESTWASLRNTLPEKGK